MLIKDNKETKLIILKMVILFGGMLGLLVLGGGKADAGTYPSGYINSIGSQEGLASIYFANIYNNNHLAYLTEYISILDTEDMIGIGYVNRDGQDLTNLAVEDVEVLDGEVILPHNAYTITKVPETSWLSIEINAGVLAVGYHVITVKPKGFTIQRTKIIVVSNNTKLNNLSLSSGNLNETFDAGQTDYTQSLDSTVTSLTVTPIVSNSLASVTVQANNGEYVAVANGQASGAVSLVNGINYIRIKVTAHSGISNTYVVTVTRPSTITKSAIAGVIRPVTGAIPVAAIAATAEYTASIAWLPASSAYSGNTGYTATITITPQAGISLNGVGANFFKVPGATTTNAAGSGVVKAVFPPTGAAAAALITTSAITGVTAPAAGVAPVTAIAATTDYTATIAWSPTSSTFIADGLKIYTATITITPKAGYTLSGVGENFFKVAGAITTNAAGSGVVRAVFPITASAPVTKAAITGVKVPVTGATPTAKLLAAAEYTGTVSWSPAAATFAGNTAYTATITITPKVGYTLAGIAANFFTVAGATTTYAAGSAVVTAVFPATGPATISSPVIAGIAAPVTGAAPAAMLVATAAYTASIAWSPVTEVFAGNTVYTTTITITPKAGYTLTGVSANYFKVAGAATTNVAGSGVVTAVFPATVVLTGMAAINAATSTAAVKVLLESDVNQTELGLTMTDYSDLSAAIRLGIAAAVFNGGTDYTTAAEIQAAFDAAVMDAEIKIQSVVSALRAASGNVAAVQSLLEMKYSELGLTMDDYNNLSSVSKTAVAASMLNYLFDPVAAIEAMFDAEVTAQPVVVFINEATSAVQVQSLLDNPALGLEFMDYYSALDVSGKLNVATAIFEGKPYTTSDSLEEVFNQEVSIQKMINDMNNAATTDEMIDLLIINQNLLELNLNTFDGRTAVAAAMMIRRPYSTAAEIKAAFIADFTAQIIATINLATSADEVQSILFVHFADIGILNIGSKKYYQFDYSARLDIAAYVFNDGANYANVASIKARFDEIAANYLP